MNNHFPKNLISSIPARAILFFIFILTAFSSYAQDSLKTNVDNEDVTVLFRNEAEGGLVVHSNGLGITFKRGWHLTGYKKQMLDIDIVSMRNSKQYKQPNPYYTESKPFFFGKLNFAYIIRAGYGRQNIIFSKAERSGVEVRYNYYVGADLGIAKPVYLQVLVDDPFGSVKVIEEKKFDPNDPDQQSVENIYGPGNYFKGFGELKVYPGVYGKFALSFEYAMWQQKITALETGIVFDYFPKAIPIMANIKNNPLLFNFYISLTWGGKW